MVCLVLSLSVNKFINNIYIGVLERERLFDSMGDRIALLVSVFYFEAFLFAPFLAKYVERAHVLRKSIEIPDYI